MPYGHNQLLKLIFSIVSLSILSSCATVHKEIISEDCNSLYQVFDTTKHQCIPKYHLEVCGKKWRCDNNRLGDSFRLTENPSKCENGEITIYKLPTTSDAAGNTLGLTIIEVYACSPMGKIPPD